MNSMHPFYPILIPNTSYVKKYFIWVPRVPPLLWRRGFLVKAYIAPNVVDSILKYVPKTFIDLSGSLYLIPYCMLRNCLTIMVGSVAEAASVQVRLRYSLGKSGYGFQ